MKIILTRKMETKISFIIIVQQEVKIQIKTMTEE